MKILKNFINKFLPKKEPKIYTFELGIPEYIKKMMEDKSKVLYEYTKVPAKYIGRAEVPGEPYKIVDDIMYIKSFCKDEFKELKKGMQVVDISDSVPYDEDMRIGTVKECDDWHNILVDFGNDSTNLYCLIKDCQEDYTIEGHGTTKINYYDDSLRAFN